MLLFRISLSLISDGRLHVCFCFNRHFYFIVTGKRINSIVARMTDIRHTSPRKRRHLRSPRNRFEFDYSLFNLNDKHFT